MKRKLRLLLMMCFVLCMFVSPTAAAKTQTSNYCKIFKYDEKRDVGIPSPATFRVTIPAKGIMDISFVYKMSNTALPGASHMLSVLKTSTRYKLSYTYNGKATVYNDRPSDWKLTLANTGSKAITVSFSATPSFRGNRNMYSEGAIRFGMWAVRTKDR